MKYTGLLWPRRGGQDPEVLLPVAYQEAVVGSAGAVARAVVGAEVEARRRGKCAGTIAGHLLEVTKSRAHGLGKDIRLGQNKLRLTLSLTSPSPTIAV